MWPIQLAFLFLISCRIFLCSLTLSNTSSFLPVHYDTLELAVHLLFSLSPFWTIVWLLYFITSGAKIYFQLCTIWFQIWSWRNCRLLSQWTLSKREKLEQMKDWRLVSTCTCPPQHSAKLVQVFLTTGSLLLGNHASAINFCIAVRTANITTSTCFKTLKQYHLM